MDDRGEGSLPRSLAVAACTFMAVFYVAVLHAPTAVLRLPPPTSFKQFILRRFFCAAISSAVSFFLSAFILPMRRWDSAHLLGAYGIRMDHLWQTVVLPLFLTSLMYGGSLFHKSLLLMSSLEEYNTCGGSLSLHFRSFLKKLIGYFYSVVSNLFAWRNYIVAPITEELVFRACMIPLLRCGGFKIHSIIFLSPIFFSLAHLNHLFEFYGQENRSLLRAFVVIGLQLGYTVVFGSYATFLFIRTGHLLAPVVAHIFCNIMGLPMLFSRRNGLVAVSSVAGAMAFVWLLFPLTRPDLYNDRADNCRCWHAYCTQN